MKKLNLGCGERPLAGYENVDIRAFPHTDKVFDFEEYPYPYQDNTFDEVFICHVLEHMLHPLKVLKEIHRISKNGAIIEVRVPFYNSGGAYNCPTHYHYYNKRTMSRIPELMPEIKLIECYTTPSVVGKFIPRCIRERLHFFIGTITTGVTAKFEVIK